MTTRAAGSSTSPIIRLDLNDQVYEAIKSRLLTREFEGGARLSTQRLADELDVSRSPVQHALTRLVAEGLVDSANRSYRVRPLTTRSLSELLDARLALELHAAELSVGKISDAQLIEFRDMMERTSKAINSATITDQAEYMRSNREFHEYQVGLADNAVISDLYRRLSVHQLLERVVMVLGVSSAEDPPRQHRQLVEAYEASDLKAAQDALRENIVTARGMVQESMERVGGAL